MMTFAIPLLVSTLFGAGVGSPAVKDYHCSFRGASADLSKRPSPLDSIVGRLGDVELKVCYSRPSARGRAIMGSLVPFDQPWRLGANEATTLYLPVSAKFGDLGLKAGVYSLYAIPGAKTWQIVVNDSAARWGIPINPAVRAHDAGTATVTSEATDAPVETLTMRFEPAPDGALTLVTEWERTRVRVTIRRT